MRRFIRQYLVYILLLLIAVADLFLYCYLNFGRWLDVLTLEGLLLDFIGAIALAMVGMNRFENRIVRPEVEQKTDPIEEGFDTLKEEGELDEDDPNFGAVASLAELGLEEKGLKEEPEVVRLEVGSMQVTPPMGDTRAVIVHTADGEEEEVANVRDFGRAIENRDTQLMNEYEDRWLRPAFVVLAFGFGLQLVSYFIRNFVT